MVPNGMTSQVHAFEPWEGGAFRISLNCDSLTYDAPTVVSKTTAQSNTFHGHVVELVPNERVVEVLEFETKDPAMRGETTIKSRSPMGMVAPTTSSFTTVSHAGCLPLTTRSGGKCHSTNSPRL